MIIENVGVNFPTDVAAIRIRLTLPTDVATEETCFNLRTDGAAIRVRSIVSTDVSAVRCRFNMPGHNTAESNRVYL